MDNGGDILQLCRLCLVKDDVNIPIFAEQGDIRQIFLKISSCLPVKVSREDKLPKKICDGCSYKLDMLYEFWNTTANAEKQLLSWLGEAGINAKLADGTISAVAQQIKPVETFVKQEAIDPSDIHTEDDDDKSYMFQQKFSVGEAGPSATVTSNDEPPPKRARRTAAVKAQIAMDPESDDDDDSGEPLTKVEDESEDSDGEDHEPPFVDVPSTSADDQPGPSGVGKDGAEAPLTSRKIKITKPKSKRPDHYLESEIDEKSHKLINLMKIEKILICKSCNNAYTNHNDLALHSKTHNAKRHYVCHLCDFEVKAKFRIERHIRGHRGYKCEVCEQTFRKVNRALQHSYSHTGEKPYKCEVCGKHLSNLKSLNMHLNTIHCEVITGMPLVKYDCVVCKKHYESETGLRRHYSSVHKELGIDLSVICEICGMRLSNVTRLKRHLRTHTGQKPFPCSLCDRSFSTKCQLTCHTRVHTGEKPYTCKFCGKRFGQSAPYRYHVKIHTGERKYICICGKGFISNSNLRTHRKTCNGPIKG